MAKVKDKTNAKRQREFQARRLEQKRVKLAKVQKAIDTMPPEYADDCKMWASPPGPEDERPRINWDIGEATHALIEAHAKTYGVTLEDVLYEIGVQWFIKRPNLYWAMKAAKINSIGS